jgi:hypothetical protein
LNKSKLSIVSNKKSFKNNNNIFRTNLNKKFYSTMKKSDLNKKQLGSYLAGIIEGDGSIYTPLDIENKKVTTKTVPHIEIVFDIKDKYLFEKIQNVLDGGFISIRSNGQSGRLIIRKQIVLLKLVKLLNGHMRTPKIEALHRLIN